MPFSFHKCPACAAMIECPEGARTAGCPNCSKSFKVDRLGRISNEQIRPRNRSATLAIAWPSWVSPWGLAAFTCGALGVASAGVLGVRAVTAALASVGVLLAVVGTLAVRRQRQPRDTAWLALGGTLSAGVLGLVVFAPQILNTYWALDTTVAPPDLNKLVAVPRNLPRAAGKPLRDDDWADAETEAIRQEDVLFRIDVVKFGSVSERGDANFLLVQFRLGCGHARPVTFGGFPQGAGQPVLKDNAGRSYAFLEQRPRKLGIGYPVFIAAKPEPVTLSAASYLDMQLVFEPPPADFKDLSLEVPAAAWGRKGLCKLRIPQCFEAAPPEPKKK